MPFSKNAASSYNNKPVGALLRESRKWPVGQLLDLQWSKLTSLLNHAYETCEFYRDRMERAGLHPQRDFKSFECLQKLPVLTKCEVQISAQKMLSTDSRIKGITKNSTGGSTGTPLNFYQDNQYRVWADAARQRAWRQFEGISKWAIEAVLWGSDRDVGRKFSYLSTLRDLLRYRTLALNTFDLDAPDILRFIRLSNLISPQILRGYASSLYFVAKFIEEERIKISSPRIIVSSAEMLWPRMREKISEVFGADIIDSYGCREVSQIATECAQHSGLHIVMENQVVEIVNEQVLITNLNNFGMPFIRYQVGDIADRIETEQCNCGREAFRLIGLKGRVSDMIELPNGKIVHAEYFTHLFYGVESVQQFQIVYSRLEKALRIQICGTDQSADFVRHIVNSISANLNFHDVKVEFSDQFVKTRAGKHRFVLVVDQFQDEVANVP